MGSRRETPCVGIHGSPHKDSPGLLVWGSMDPHTKTLLVSLCGDPWIPTQGLALSPCVGIHGSPHKDSPCLLVWGSMDPHNKNSPCLLCVGIHGSPHKDSP